jgi:hypothetical protein
MKKPISSLAIGVCLLALSAGAALANNLHSVVTNPPPNTVVSPNGTGQTGSNVLSNCNPSGGTSFGATNFPGNAGSANGSPFNGNVMKTYAGNPGSPTFAGGGGLPAGHSNANTNTAVAQYDNACAQHQLH